MSPMRVIRGLYAIADTLYLDETQLTLAVEQALRGGARVIQYRDKSHSPGERMRHAAALRSACAAHRACFIVNNDIELARGAGADGVHLGRRDAAIEVARDLLERRGARGERRRSRRELRRVRKLFPFAHETRRGARGADRTASRAYAR